MLLSIYACKISSSSSRVPKIESIIGFHFRKFLLWNFRVWVRGPGTWLRLRPFGIRLKVENHAAPQLAGTSPTMSLS